VLVKFRCQRDLLGLFSMHAAYMVNLMCSSRWQGLPVKDIACGHEALPSLSADLQQISCCQLLIWTGMLI